MAVYFIGPLVRLIVKIGFATNVERRLKELQAGNELRFVAYRVMEGDRATEAALHKLYAGQRIDREWFRWSDDMLTVECGVRTPARALTALGRWCERAGSTPAEIARFCDVSHEIARLWCNGGRMPSKRHWAAIETATAGGVTRQMLRPDIFEPA